MNLNECYKSFNGNYDETLTRLGSEALLRKLLAKFPSDNSLSKLESALDEGNYAEAFLAVHTLKGVALNMGFTDLADSSSQLTELLRPGNPCEYAALLETVKKDHKKVYDAITNI